MTAWQIAIETSGRLGSVALLRQDELVERIMLDSEARTAQTLAPAVRELMATLKRSGSAARFVTVGVGPGSFTGLRIGVTAAKTLAYALRCPVVPCDCLAAIIARNRDSRAHFARYDAATNAYRGQVFTRRESSHGEVLVASIALDMPDWIASLAGPPTLVAGDATRRAGELPANVVVADPDLDVPTADQIGRLGWRLFDQGHSLDPFAVRPMYLRESAAVEKRTLEKRP